MIVALFGALSLTTGASLGGYQAWTWSQTSDWNKVKPVWLLHSQAKKSTATSGVAVLEELVASFASQRRAFLDRLEPLDVDTFARTVLHPRLKVPMRLVDMCVFIADHDDYHLARITELSRAFSATGAGS